jgi:CDP-glucose 4,6-dehydratase
VEEMVMSPDRNFWRGKKVFVTGHTGFKGAWLCFWLHSMGAQVTGVALPPDTEPSLFKLLGLENIISSAFLDIRNPSQLAVAVKASGAEVVFHLAAQALVREGYKNPLSTFETNFGGTANLLEALRGHISARVAVIVTTDKVYKNLGNETPFVETDELGGRDPYSASKAAAELLVESYRESYFRSQGLAIATARAGNVIGGGDWSAERLIPDCVKAWSAGQTVEIRMPDAVRPWQHVLDPLAGYLVLAQKLWEYPALASSYNFGPDADGSASVREAVTLAQSKWGNAEAHVKFGTEMKGPKESEILRLNNARARASLGFDPLWPLGTAISRSVDWYKGAKDGKPATLLCAADIDAYERGAV